MPISYTTYMKIFALSYLMSLLISATFEDVIIHTLLSTYLKWVEFFGFKLRPTREYRFPDGSHHTGDLRKRSFWTSSSASGFGFGDRGHRIVERVDDLPATPTRPGHALSVGILAIIAGACFLLLMSLFLGLYCCCIRKRASDALRSSTVNDVEKGNIGASTSDVYHNEKITTPTRATPIPVFEFSPPSPTWVPSMPTLASAIQASQRYDHNHLRPVPPVPTDSRNEPPHIRTQTQAIRNHAPRLKAVTETQTSQGTPSIKILINDEEHDTDAVIASSSPLMRRAIKKSGPTGPISRVQAGTSRVLSNTNDVHQTTTGLGISTLNLAPGPRQMTNGIEHDKTGDAHRSTSTGKGTPLKSDDEAKPGKSNQELKRDTWSRLSTVISRFSRSSLAYLADDATSETDVDNASRPADKITDRKEGLLSRTAENNRAGETEVEKRRRRRTGMVGKSMSQETSIDRYAASEEPSSLKKDVDKKGVDLRILVDGRAEPETSVASISQPDAQGLPTLGSSSMDSLLAYLSETLEPEQPQPDSSSKKVSSVTSPRHASNSNEEPKASQNVTTRTRNRFEGSKEALSTPASPLLTLVKNISSHGMKKIGTSSYEAWLSNVPSPILKSPRNNGYQKLQQTRKGAGGNEYEPEGESRVGERKREGRHQSLRGLGLQVDGSDLAQDTVPSTTESATIEPHRSVKRSKSRQSSSVYSLSEMRKSRASLPDAQEGLNKALAALDELALGLKSNRQAMSKRSGKDTDANPPTPTRDGNESQSEMRPSRKSLAKSRTGSAVSVDHKPGTVLPLRVKQKGRSTSIDVNVQSALQRTPFVTRTFGAAQSESKDYRRHDEADLNHRVQPSLAEEYSMFDASDFIGQDFDIRMPSPRRDSVASVASSTNSSPDKRASQRLDWCRESLTPRFNHLAAILEGRDNPPPVPRFAGSVVLGKGKTKQA